MTYINPNFSNKMANPKQSKLAKYIMSKKIGQDVMKLWKDDVSYRAEINKLQYWFYINLIDFSRVIKDD